MACKRNKIYFLRSTNGQTSTWVGFIAMQLFFLSNQNSKWDGTRIIFNLKSLYNVCKCMVCNVCVLFQMLATVCAEKHAKFFRLKMIWKIFRCTVKRFIWNTFNAIFLHFHFAIECSLTLFLYHFFKGSFELTNKPYIKTSSVSFFLKRFPLGSCTTTMGVLFAILCTLFHYARFSFAIVRGTHTLPSNFLVLKNVIKVVVFVSEFVCLCLNSMSNCWNFCYGKNFEWSGFIVIKIAIAICAHNTWN